MRRLHHLALFVLYLLASGATADGPAATDGGCGTAPEILSITGVPVFSAIDQPGSTPVYEVKYRQCGRDYRLLVTPPADPTVGLEPRFDPIFF